jgi:hypothetical protein
MGVSAPSRPLTPFRGLGCDKAALSRLPTMEPKSIREFFIAITLDRR